MSRKTRSKNSFSSAYESFVAASMYLQCTAGGGAPVGKMMAVQTVVEAEVAAMMSAGEEVAQGGEGKRPSRS